METKDIQDQPRPGPQLQTTVEDKVEYVVGQQSEPSSKDHSHALHPADDFIHYESIRSPVSFWSLFRFVADLVLIVPPLLFLVYGFLVLHNEGKPIDAPVVRRLQSAAKYSPTVFPIVYAAIAGSFLKSVAAWKLEHERGISVLSLEYLLSSRTVFSAATTPVNLRAFNFLTPLLLMLWALSPLGGQAAFRIIGTVPNTFSTPWNFTYLEYGSDISYRSPTSSEGSRVISQVVGAFTSALLATEAVKLGPQDAFGNLKIPMVEACKSAGARPDSDDWNNALPGAGCNYSSLIGLPAVPRTNTGAANMTFTIETQYTYANCTLSHHLLQNRSAALDYINSNYTIGNYTMAYRNSIRSFVIRIFDWPVQWRPDPLQLLFTSITDNAVTNATCRLTTSYVEARVLCHNAACEVRQVRESKNPRNRTALTVLDGVSPYNYGVTPSDGFFSTFVKATDSPWEAGNSHLYSTPIEYYFTHPEAPYSAELTDGNATWNPWRGEEIFPIGDLVFSQRFSQLLNTFWLSAVAPLAVTSFFNMSSNGTLGQGYAVVNTTGELTPDFIVLDCRRGWLGILVLASAVMLVAALAAAVFGLLRRGPDILDRASLFLRENPYARVPRASTMEDGFDQARRLKKVRLFLGDVQAGHERGHVAVGTVDAVTPLHRVDMAARVY